MYIFCSAFCLNDHFFETRVFLVISEGSFRKYLRIQTTSSAPQPTTHHPSSNPATPFSGCHGRRRALGEVVSSVFFILQRFGTTGAERAWMVTLVRLGWGFTDMDSSKTCRVQIEDRNSGKPGSVRTFQEPDLLVDKTLTNLFLGSMCTSPKSKKD